MSYNCGKTIYTKDKTKSFHLRITDEIDAMLLTLSEVYNCSPSEVVRKLIKKEGHKYADEQGNLNY